MNYKKIIIVKNTKELEKMDLSRMSDDVQVQVLGGIFGKQKYAKDHYRARTTYPLGQLKQIIATMHEIESNINPNWPEITRARYIYEILGSNISYDFNRENYSNQQASNLSILLSREGICAGYSLLFKEMMDRQGIECDYVRGNAFNSKGGREKHAWNVLKINGKNIPIDLTWDAPHIKNNEGLYYFGNNYRFTDSHVLDNDEVQYRYDYLSQEELKEIDFRNYKQQQDYNVDIKKKTYLNALRETYIKYSKLEGPDKALNRVQVALYEYLVFNYTDGFTRDGFARDNLEKNVSREEVLEYIIDDYMQKYFNIDDAITIQQSSQERFLSDAINETIRAYSPEQAKSAVKRFICTGQTSMFTNQGYSKARTTLAYNVSNIDVLNILIDDTIKKELSRQYDIDQYANVRNEKIGKAFSGRDFELVNAPKDKSIFRKAIDWIKEKTRSLKKSRDNSERNGKQSARSSEKNVKHKKDNDYYER